MTHDRILEALTRASSPRSKKWEPEAVALELATAFKDEMDQRQANRDAHDAAIRNLWADIGAKLDAINLQPLPVGPVDPNVPINDREATSAAIEREVAAKVAQNKVLFQGFFETVTGLASAYFTGGLTAPAVVAALMPVAQNIAAALNGE